jgi:RHS repeat-associated protein
MVALNKKYQKTLTPDRSAKDSGLRFYSANLSRWLSRDPMGELGEPGLYAFVDDDPVGLTDSIGLAVYEVDNNTGFHVHPRGAGPHSASYGVDYDPATRSFVFRQRSGHPCPRNMAADFASRARNPRQLARMHRALTESPNIRTAPESARRTGRGFRHIRQGRRVYVAGLGRLTTSPMIVFAALEMTVARAEEEGCLNISRRLATCELTRSYRRYFGLGACIDEYVCRCPPSYRIWLFMGLVPVSETTERVRRGCPVPRIWCVAQHGGQA